jgi:Polysaccharide deacetylase
MSRSAVQSIAVAAKGKGASNLARRARTIGARYGIGPQRMERRLGAVLNIVGRFGCGATLPVTAAAVERNPRVIARYADLGIEFAVHGYHHVDHIGLSPAEQLSQLGRARRILEDHGIPAVGFRAPYLRWNDDTVAALAEHGFLYDSSQAMHWPIDPELQTDAYRRGLAFCDALPATEYPVLPRIDRGIVRIPCCLPDDEAAVDRIRLADSETIADLWLDILRSTYERGELFTLAVHPERIDVCGPAIAAVLSAAGAAQPTVWIARLDQISRWWSARADSTVAVRDEGGGRFQVDVSGPIGSTVLYGNNEVSGSGMRDDATRSVRSDRLVVRSRVRPVIGLHPASPDALRAFLREQGYIAEAASSGERYAFFLDLERFSRTDEQPLLAELEAGPFPLLRLGRWPNGARSALAVTGDVDALTIWDYALRFFGR